MGSVIGGLLAGAGHTVTLLGRARHLDAVATDGLRITGLYGEHHVRSLRIATSIDALNGPFDTVLLTVKAWDTTAMSTAVAPQLAPDGVLICLQNGLGNMEHASAAVGTKHVLGGRVIFGAEVTAPGHAFVSVHAEPTLIGAPSADVALASRAASIAQALADAGVPAEPTATITADLWAKLLYNAALNPLGALLRVPYGHLPRDPDAKALMDQIIAEAFAVAVATGVTLRWPTAAAYAETFYGRLVPSTAEHRSSMLQDLERGRPTEIDAINGWVAARAAEHHLSAPVNATLTRVIHARTRVRA